MSDGGVVTAQVGQFNVSSNSGASAEEIAATLKPKADKAASEAASQLGRRGAEARKAKEDAPDVNEAKGEEKPAIKPIPPKNGKAEAEKAEPEPEQKAEAAEEKPEEKPEKRGNPRHDPEARVREATREAAEARRQLAEARQAQQALEARLAALERGERPQPAQEKPAPKQGDGKPVLSDFLAQHETYEQGVEAYLDARREHERAAERAQEESTRGARQALEGFIKAAASVKDKLSPEVAQLRPIIPGLPGFDLEPGQQGTVYNYIANEILFSGEAAPTLLLHFSEHPDEFQRIAALPNPRAVSREMAMLEARLAAATTAPAPSVEREESVSKATPPVRPVTGQPYVTESAEFRPGMSLDEYHKVWKRQQQR